jgi:hypothetical protein
MTEATFVNLILTLRVLLVGGIFIVLPRKSRKGLLFGTYIGEATADRDAARQLLGRWSLRCVILMAISLMIGLAISAAGRPLTGNYTGTAVLLLGGAGLYLQFYYAARKLAPPLAAEQAGKAVAPLLGGEPKGVGLAKLALGICLLVPVAAFAWVMVSSDGASAKSFAVARITASLNLAFSPFFALYALLTARAKRSIRGGSGGRSVEAQDAFRATLTNLFSWLALVFCAYWTVLSVQIVRIGFSPPGTLSLWIGWMSSAVVVFLLVNLIRIMKSYGQGGSVMERATADTPLTNGLADNARWVLGLFYVDRDDPSILVEKRFGIGYTFNFGNRKSVLIVVAFSLLILGLIAFNLFGTPLGGG